MGNRDAKWFSFLDANHPMYFDGDRLMGECKKNSIVRCVALVRLFSLLQFSGEICFVIVCVLRTKLNSCLRVATERVSGGSCSRKVETFSIPHCARISMKILNHFTVQRTWNSIKSLASSNETSEVAWLNTNEQHSNAKQPTWLSSSQLNDK